MIQRIQTIWLLIAAILCAGVFYFDLYHADVTVNGASQVQYVKVNDHFPSLIVALIMTAIPFISIFLFKNRGKQRSLVLFGIVVTIGFIALTLMRVTNFNNGTSAPHNGTYWIGSVLPVVSLIFQFMGLNGIKRDEKLVRSIDRLR